MAPRRAPARDNHRFRTRSHDRVRGRRQVRSLFCLRLFFISFLINSFLLCAQFFVDDSDSDALTPDGGRGGSLSGAERHFGRSARNSDAARLVASEGAKSAFARPSLKRQLTKHVVTRWYRPPELILAARSVRPRPRPRVRVRVRHRATGLFLSSAHALTSHPLSSPPLPAPPTHRSTDRRSMSGPSDA